MNEQVLFLKTLADTTRLKLLRLILDEELCVCEIQPLLGISQPAVSQHVAKLKAAGLVQERRAGMWTYYRGDRQRLQDGLAAVAGLMEADPLTIPELAEAAARRKGLNRVTLCGCPTEEDETK
jgi:ArsR family transcriptional regulator